MLTQHYSYKNIIKLFFVCVRHNAQLQKPKLSYLFFHDGFHNESIKSDMKVIEDFVTEEEECSLLQEIEPQLKRMRYETGHWDNAIQGYRESEKLNWNSNNSPVIDRLRKIAFPSGSKPLKHTHILDLLEDGVIMPHIDSIKFCGSTIAGISLLSDSVMRLVNEKNKDEVVDVLLKRRSLYIMTASARYDYTHEILGNKNSSFGGKIIKKNRRISVICRNEPAVV